MITRASSRRRGRCHPPRGRSYCDLQPQRLSRGCPRAVWHRGTAARRLPHAPTRPCSERRLRSGQAAASEFAEAAHERWRIPRVAGTPRIRPNGFAPAGIRGTYLKTDARLADVNRFASDSSGALGESIDVIQRRYADRQVGAAQPHASRVGRPANARHISRIIRRPVSVSTQQSWGGGERTGAPARPASEAAEQSRVIVVAAVPS